MKANDNVLHPDFANELLGALKRIAIAVEGIGSVDDLTRLCDEVDTLSDKVEDGLERVAEEVKEHD